MNAKKDHSDKTDVKIHIQICVANMLMKRKINSIFIAMSWNIGGAKRNTAIIDRNSKFLLKRAKSRYKKRICSLL